MSALSPKNGHGQPGLSGPISARQATSRYYSIASPAGATRTGERWSMRRTCRVTRGQAAKGNCGRSSAAD